MTERFDATTLPLMLLFASFVVTFLATRTVTRLIRSGRGPFSDNVSGSGLHIHHAVPGLFLLVAGAVTTTGSATTAFRCLGGIAVGIGACLVLDEFALILHLQDVYWAKEGRASVQAVTLVAVCLCLVCLGFAPVTSTDFQGSAGDRIVVAALLLCTIWTVWICARKGKYRLALLSIFLPPVAWVLAIRLARPGSPWFRKHYVEGSRKYARAVKRAARSDARWGNRWVRFADLIAGAPSDSEPAAERIER